MNSQRSSCLWLLSTGIKGPKRLHWMDTLFILIAAAVVL